MTSGLFFLLGAVFGISAATLFLSLTDLFQGGPHRHETLIDIIFNVSAMGVTIILVFLHA